MQLEPVKRARKPRYPSLLRREARRLVSTAALSASLLLVSCASGARRADLTSGAALSRDKQAVIDRRLNLCEPQPRLSGDMIAPAVPPFTCARAHSPTMAELRLPSSPSRAGSVVPRRAGPGSGSRPGPG